MDASRSEGKRVLRYNEEEEDEEEEGEEEEEVETGFGEEGRRNKRVMTDLYGKKGSKAGGSMPPSCQVDNCDADLSEAKQYHRRHKVCEYHAKVHSVLMAGLQQRLQQIFQRQESFPCQLSFLQNSVFSDSMSCLNLMNQKGVVEHDWLAIMRGVAKMQLTVVENNFFYVTMNINKP
ncbi:hypothetical protein ACSQ67_004368 [Phaseolus vulgaris]